MMGLTRPEYNYVRKIYGSFNQEIETQNEGFIKKRVDERLYVKNKPPDKSVGEWLVLFWGFELFWKRTIPPDILEIGEEVGRGLRFIWSLFCNAIDNFIVPDAEMDGERRGESVVDWMMNIMIDTFKTIKVEHDRTEKPVMYVSNGTDSNVEAWKRSRKDDSCERQFGRNEVWEISMYSPEDVVLEKWKLCIRKKDVFYKIRWKQKDMEMETRDFALELKRSVMSKGIILILFSGLKSADDQWWDNLKPMKASPIGFDVEYEYKDDGDRDEPEMEMIDEF
jgi:hypothetical protein